MFQLPSWWWQRPNPSGAATWKQRLTGADMDTCRRWRVCGTDLGIPYDVPTHRAVDFLFGDTFDSPWPEQPDNDWRSPVKLRSASDPRNGIVFDSAAGAFDHPRAPELFWNGHNSAGEVTAIPNDGVVLPDGRHVVSFMSVRDWVDTGHRSWLTNYAGLAVSDNGNHFVRTTLRWRNNGAGDDPYQMWSMQLHGDHVYIVSVPCGRQRGGMMLRRVRWEKILDPAAYEGWGWDGSSWGWGRPPTPILTGRFGEPSLRLLRDGTWVLAYLNMFTGSIVTRTAQTVDGVWSAEKVQVTSQQEPALYGGFVHPWSTRDALFLLVSAWRRNQQGQSSAYHVSLYRGTL